jgi:hypothetical protein
VLNAYNSGHDAMSYKPMFDTTKSDDRGWNERLLSSNDRIARLKQLWDVVTSSINTLAA